MNDHGNEPFGSRDDSGDAGLRRLLHDAVDDVHPTTQPDDVRERARSGVTPIGAGRGSALRRWVPVSVAAAAAMALVVGGTLFLTQRGEDTPPVAGPSASPSAGQDGSDGSPEASQAPAHQKALAIYYVGDTAAGPRLFREFHRAPVAGGSPGATEGLRLALTGTPQDPDYRTAWRGVPEAEVDSASSGRVEVRFDGTPPTDRPDGMSGAEASISVQQLVYTAQAQLQSTDPVTFSGPDGELETLLGVDVAGGVARGAADEVLSPISVDGPVEGAEVSSPFSVEGQAATFEGNVQWRLEREGEVVKQGFTTAEECCTLAPYRFTVEAPPGDYTLVVTEEDVSGGEGNGTTQDTKQIRVE